MCIISPTLVKCGSHQNIQLLTLSELTALEGEVGHFTATVRQQPRYVDMEKCIACGVCAEKCPAKVEDAFNEGLNKRKAAYVLYPQAVPQKYSIDQDRCIYFKPDKNGKTGRRGACAKFCPAGAVDFSDQGKEHKIEVGAVILAPGAKTYDPGQMSDFYLYGKHPNVITALEFERILSASGSVSRSHGAAFGSPGT